MAVWRNGNIVGRIDKVSLCWSRLALQGWVIAYGWANHLIVTSHTAGKLSLLTSAGREMNTDQSIW